MLTTNLSCNKENESKLIEEIIDSLFNESNVLVDCRVHIEPEYFNTNNYSQIPAIIWKVANKLIEEHCPYRLLEWTVSKSSDYTYTLDMQFRAVRLDDLAGVDTGKIIGRTARLSH